MVDTIVVMGIIIVALIYTVYVLGTKLGLWKTAHAAILAEKTKLVTDFNREKTALISSYEAEKAELTSALNTISKRLEDELKKVGVDPEKLFVGVKAKYEAELSALLSKLSEYEKQFGVLKTDSPAEAPAEAPVAGSDAPSSESATVPAEAPVDKPIVS